MNLYIEIPKDYTHTEIHAHSLSEPITNEFNKVERYDSL